MGLPRMFLRIAAPRARPVEELRALVSAHVRLTSALLVTSACLVAWFFCKPLIPVFPLDDAYIHLAYVRCFARSGQFCFNPGEPSLGTSSPLHVLLLVPFFRAGLDPYATERSLGLICSVASALLCRVIARRACREGGASREIAEGAGLLAGVLVAWNGAVLWMAFSGMETPLLLAVSLALVWSFTRRGYDVVTGALAGVLFLVRAPGAVIALLLLAIELAGGRWRRCIPGALVSAVFALPMMVTSYLDHGSGLPHDGHRQAAHLRARRLRLRRDAALPRPLRRAAEVHAGQLPALRRHRRERRPLVAGNAGTTDPPAASSCRSARPPSSSRSGARSTCSPTSGASVRSGSRGAT